MTNRTKNSNIVNKNKCEWGAYCMAMTKSWNYKQIAGFYDRVRAALSHLSSASLPDEYIDMPEKAKFAELYAKSKVPNWMNLDESDEAIFESAIIYKTASMFESLASSNAIRKKELPTISLEFFENKAISVDGFSLGDWADILLAQLAQDEDTNFIGFVVT